MPPPLYGHDLAAIHRDGFSDLARGASPVLLAALRAQGIRGGRVVDLGCGGGLWLQRLASAGYQAIGVEPSPAMAKLARATAPKARVLVSSAYDYRWSPCDAVTAMGEVLGYSATPARHPARVRRLFTQIARALRPGGLLVFDIIVAGRDRMAYRTWRAGPGWAVLVEIAEDRKRALLRRDITSFRRAGTTYRRAHERHLVRVFSRAEIVADLRRLGFTVKTTTTYGPTPVAPRRLVFWARKRREPPRLTTSGERRRPAQR